MRIIETVIFTEVDVTVVTGPLRVQGASRNGGGILVTTVEPRINGGGTPDDTDGLAGAHGDVGDVDATRIRMLELVMGQWVAESELRAL